MSKYHDFAKPFGEKIREIALREWNVQVCVCCGGYFQVETEEGLYLESQEQRQDPVCTTCVPEYLEPFPRTQDYNHNLRIVADWIHSKWPSERVTFHSQPAWVDELPGLRLLLEC